LHRRIPGGANASTRENVSARQTPQIIQLSLLDNGQDWRAVLVGWRLGRRRQIWRSEPGDISAVVFEAYHLAPESLGSSLKVEVAGSASLSPYEKTILKLLKISFGEMAGPDLSAFDLPSYPFCMLLRRAAGSSWQVDLLDRADGDTSNEAGDIRSVVAAARARAGDHEEKLRLKLKVEPGTRLSTDDVLALVQEGRSGDLDLSGCDLSHIDLSPEVIKTKYDAWQQAHKDPPRWCSGARGGVRGEPSGVELNGIWLRGAELYRAQLQRADLRGAQLQRANLTHAQLHDADLTSARLYQANLTWVRLHDAHLARATFGAVDFDEASLQKVDFYEAASLDGAFWNRAHLDKTRLRRDQLGGAIGEERRARQRSETERQPSGEPTKAYDYFEAAETYLLLKHNFSENGRYEDASWAYVKEQQMRKRGHRHRCERDFRTWRHLAPWAWKWAAELVTGYGEQPWRTAICAVLVVLFFTAIYAWFGLVSAAYSGPASVQSQGAPAPSSIWDALIYSVATFCTVNYTALNPVGRAAHMLASAESAIGLALFGLFLWTLGNRISRG